MLDHCALIANSRLSFQIIMFLIRVSNHYGPLFIIASVLVAIPQLVPDRAMQA
jgi:hypothetical protein